MQWSYKYNSKNKIQYIWNVVKWKFEVASPQNTKLYLHHVPQLPSKMLNDDFYRLPEINSQLLRRFQAQKQYWVDRES